MTMTDSGYEIRLLNGTLYVNGQVAEDFLDCDDRRYTATTPSRLNQELYRLVRIAFERGAESQRHSVVPIVGDVR